MIIVFVIFACILVVFGVLDYCEDFRNKKSLNYEPAQPTLCDTYHRLYYKHDKVEGRIAYAAISVIVYNVMLVLEKDPEDVYLCHNRVRGHIEMVIESIDDYIMLSNGRRLANVKQRAKILSGFYEIGQGIKSEVDRIDRHLAIQITCRNEVINQKSLGG